MENIYMRHALTLAIKATESFDVPVGAVIVDREKKIIVGEGYNMREKYNDPIAHAEIIAIRQASQNIGSWRLSGCDLYVTLEPCPMCSGAIINSRIDNVYFGAFDKKSGAICSVEEMFRLSYNHKPAYYGGIMEIQCKEILSSFFKDLRK